MFRAAVISVFLASALDAAPRVAFIRQFGGSHIEYVRALARDSSGNLFVAGTTNSFDFPAATLQIRPGGSNLYRIAGNKATALFSLRTPNLKSLAVASADANVLYASTDLGPFKSVDGGDSWTPLAGSPGCTPYCNFFADPSSEDRVYAVSPCKGIFKSVDGGASWSAAGDGLPPSREGNFYYSLTIDPAQPENVFASSSDNHLYRSLDGGVTWVVQDVWLFSIEFDPRRPGTAYGADLTGLFKTTNGGQSWVALGSFDGRALSSAKPLAIAPDGRLWVASTKGLWSTADDGASWTWAEGVYGIQNVAADPRGNLVYAADYQHAVVSSDGFKTWSAAGPARWSGPQALALARNPADPGGPSILFASSAYGPTNAFVAKLSSSGEVLWATYFGGATREEVAGVAVDAEGNVYVAGTTNSLDFPLTEGAYKREVLNPYSVTAGYVFKLSPDGALVYSTLLFEYPNAVAALAVDRSGSAYVTGYTNGNLPVTAGVVQPGFRPAATHLRGQAVSSPALVPIPQPSDAFALKLKPDGSGLAYCTYLGDPDQAYHSGTSISVDDEGNAFVSSRSTVWKLNSTASAALFTTELPGAQIQRLALGGDSLFVTGNKSTPAFQTTPGAFMPRTNPDLSGLFPWLQQNTPFAARLAAGSAEVRYSTLFGGEADDRIQAIAPDAQGNLFVAGLAFSSYFPTIAPMQGRFANSTGFVARIAPDGSRVGYSTFVGDQRPFSASGVVVDDQGAAVFAGHTDEQIHCCTTDHAPGHAPDAFVVRLTQGEEDRPRVDAVLNSASLGYDPMSPGQFLTVTGAGFGPDAALILGGRRLATIERSESKIVVQVPGNSPEEGALYAQVESGGQLSQSVAMPAAAVSPQIFTADGRGFGQALVLHEDGSLNSPSNPAAPGDIVSIVCNGIGRYGKEGGSAVPASPVSVFISYWYAKGVDAQIRKIPGVPGEAFVIKVYVPNPKPEGYPDYRLPTSSFLWIEVAGVRSQEWVTISIRP